MTSVFGADGKNVPCTVIEVGPCTVTQIKNVEKDGYEAVQVGFQEAKEKHTSAPLLGHFKKAGVTPKRHLAEFKNFEKEYNLGDVITVEGPKTTYNGTVELVDVTVISIKKSLVKIEEGETNAFDANGGEGTMADQVVTEGSTATHCA